ncbi:MAG: hypothetical protein LLG04_12865 [Parachlamydia sp.]|nr:hypothetical protein [Parachlamydia sp.]
MAAKDDGFNAGSIDFALTDQRFQAVLTTRRLVQLHPKQVNNPEIPWDRENVMEFYTDTKTEDLLLILYRHFRTKDSAAYYGFDPSKLRKISNQDFQNLLKHIEERPTPKATVDDVMDLFNSARKINRRVLWTGHGGPDSTIAGMTCADFLKAHQRLNAMHPQIEGIASCLVGGKHRLALARVTHEHPVVLAGSDDLVSFAAFVKPFSNMCRNLDKSPPLNHTVEDIRALMEGTPKPILSSINDEPQVILPFHKGVRLIDPTDKFIIAKNDSQQLHVPKNRWAALYTTYISDKVTFELTAGDSGMFYSQIAGDAHHLFEEVQFPSLSFEDFHKALLHSWVPSMKVKAFFIKKLLLSDRKLENVILTNLGGETRMLYRQVTDPSASYAMYSDKETLKEIDRSTYLSTALDILKQSKPSEEAVRLATEGSDEAFVYEAIQKMISQ